MTGNEYINRKNRRVSFDIVSISSQPDYKGGEKFHIYLSYDDDREAYAFPDRPALTPSNQVTSGLFKAEPSLKPEWFPNFDDYIELSNGSTISVFGAGNWETSDYFATPYRYYGFKLRDPNGNVINGTATSGYGPGDVWMYGRSTGNPLASQDGMRGFDDASGKVTATAYSGGGYVSIRMNWNSWQDYINYLQTGTGSDAPPTAMMRCQFFASESLFGSSLRYYDGLPYGGNMAQSVTMMRRLYTFFNGAKFDEENVSSDGFTDDPSKPQGGGGDFDDLGNTDDIPEYDPSETEGLTALGTITTHKLTMSELESFHNFLFSDAFNNTWDSIRKSFGDPQQCIVSMRALYVPIPDGPRTNILLGNVDSQVSAIEVTQDYASFNCGTAEIPEIWGNFLDYDPYTKISVYLPFCGTVNLAASEVVGGKISIKYNVDLFSGSCVAIIYVERTDKYSTSKGPIAQINGNCGIQIPWTSFDASQQWNAIFRGATVIAAGIGGAAVMQAQAGASSAQLAAQSAATAAGPPTASQFAVQQANTAAAAASMKAAAVGHVNNTVLNTASQLPAMTGIFTQNITRSGSLAGNVGVLSQPTPFITITRPIQSLPENYNRFYGYPSNITKRLSECKGFTKVAHVNLTDIGANSKELELIQTALQSGVIIK